MSTSKKVAEFNAGNERIKRQYLTWLHHADGKSKTTVDAYADSVRKYEQATRFRDFAKFRKEDAIAFKAYLGTLRNREGLPLTISTLVLYLRQVKGFFRWLAWQPGFRSRITFTDVAYFNPTDNDLRSARPPSPRAYPTPEQIEKVLDLMPAATEIERRNRALFAFTYLSGARVKAAISLKLKHVDLDRCLIDQRGDEVDTKRRKSFLAFFFPVGPQITNLFVDWVNYLRNEKGYSEDMPLFPRTLAGRTEENTFKPVGLEPEHWATATQLREIFEEAYVRAGLPNFHPHAVRFTLVALGRKYCKDYDSICHKAWSQNLGHRHVVTTQIHYDRLEDELQGEVMRNLAVAPRSGDSNGGGLPGLADVREELQQMEAVFKKMRAKVM